MRPRLHLERGFETLLTKIASSPSSCVSCLSNSDRIQPRNGFSANLQSGLAYSLANASAAYSPSLEGLYSSGWHTSCTLVAVRDRTPGVSLAVDSSKAERLNGTVISRLSQSRRIDRSSHDVADEIAGWYNVPVEERENNRSSRGRLCTSDGRWVTTSKVYQQR